MEHRQTKPRRRLKVFEQISTVPTYPISRTLEINRVPNPSYLLYYLGMYGEVMCLDHGPSGQVLVTYFDIRHAIQAKSQLSGHFPVRYMPDDREDSLRMPLQEEPRLEQFQDGIMEVDRGDGMLKVRFFDLRTLRQVVSPREDDLFIENEFHDNPLPFGSDVNKSINSDSTSPSPYIPSDERKKPKKKPVNEKDKRLFVIDLDNVINGLNIRTTVMIRNIPNKYSQTMLLETINQDFSYTYDFFYLPIDFKVLARQNKCNVGYAFINFLDFRVIPRFYKEFNCKKWERFNSDKVCALAYASIQGTSSLVQHFQRSSVMNQLDANLRPLLFPTYS